MNLYIQNRLRADGRRAIFDAGNQADVAHRGLRGRFREILVRDLLVPWLPPYCRCGTGRIIDCRNVTRESNQDDIVVFDPSLVPPVLISNRSEYDAEGTFPLEGVLARIEVKSKLTRAELKSAVEAAAEIHNMKFAQNGSWGLPPTAIFAFDSDLSNKRRRTEFDRFQDVLNELKIDLASPMVSLLCVVGRGCWSFNYHNNEGPFWWETPIDEPADEIVQFVAMMSNTCYGHHMMRQGREPGKTAESGVGLYVIDDSRMKHVGTSRIGKSARSGSG